MCLPVMKEGRVPLGKGFAGNERAAAGDLGVWGGEERGGEGVTGQGIRDC